MMDIADFDLPGNRQWNKFRSDSYDVDDAAFGSEPSITNSRSFAVLKIVETKRKRKAAFDRQSDDAARSSNLPPDRETRAHKEAWLQSKFSFHKLLWNDAHNLAEISVVRVAHASLGEFPSFASVNPLLLSKVFLASHEKPHSFSIHGPIGHVSALVEVRASDHYAQLTLDSIDLGTKVAATEINTIPDWLSAVQRGADEQVTDEALSCLFQGILDLVDVDDFAELDKAVSNVVPDQMPSVVLVAVVRYLFAVREDLSSWNTLVDRIRSTVAQRHLDSTEILSDLDAD